eukprot:TRINITY_DN6572_c0_g1_i1.p1 TRINITY_DN6572_c0_g1~~TRINITY_DN6572_c0_g1_i1.p1  ORF type:complete len:241 (+),score=47.53 TRINITY_DN6572_c0_g1_i1:140-862(+)
MPSSDTLSDLGITVAVGIFLAGVLIKALDYLAKKNVLSSFFARKSLHILIGPIYIAVWPLYKSQNGPYLAALLPGLIGAKFFLIGLGILKDEDTVRSVSRTGNYREVLYGPSTYGLIHVLATIFFWRNSPVGIVSLLLLCIGDGFAGLLGKGSREKLPWNKDKSVKGSLAFFLTSIPVISFYIWWFHSMGYISWSLSQCFPAVFATTLVCTLIESLPYQQDWDNLTVFAASVFFMKSFGL